MAETPERSGVLLFLLVFLKGVLKWVGGRRWFLVVSKRCEVWIVWSVDCTFSQAENVPRFGNKSVEILALEARG